MLAKTDCCGRYGYDEINLGYRFLDRYRDKKEIAEDVLKEHLANTSPYKALGMFYS